MSVIYGVGNVVWKETCNLNMLILSAAVSGLSLKDVWFLSVPSSCCILPYLASNCENNIKNIQRLNQVQLATGEKLSYLAVEALLGRTMLLSFKVVHASSVQKKYTSL